jgi:RNase H-fold protein (predicted Holliday junction resolvase)
MQGNVLAIDPGKFRSGLAVLSPKGIVISRSVVKTLVLPEEVRSVCAKFSVSLIIIGSGGPGRMIEKSILSMDINPSVIFVNEKGSTLEARKLYWQENPPKGLFRLIPRTLLIPGETYDDYAAIVIGKRYLKGS